MLLECVEQETGPAPAWTVLWLHGLGADGREVHGEGVAGYGWTFTPVEVGDQACGPFWAELDALPGQPEWLEPAPAHHVLRLW